ncbi:hypothetical protein LTR53_003150 [Teratosphaeriaceae sp. CCFEE 6253]|nr:hypothetical protein LTR53_003150 [Teratosphaeriaceae sp. CCFEE 6253]
MDLAKRTLDVQKPSDPTGAIIEAWAQGYMIGSLVIMACVAFSNMRRGVLLHKLILIEVRLGGDIMKGEDGQADWGWGQLCFGMFHGTFIFTEPPVYNWYLSITAIFLNVSWSLHNIIAWLKNRPFLPPWGSRLYIATVVLVQPYWVLEIVANFLYFSDRSALFTHTRPYEALARDPWWIFTVLNLLYNIRSRYDFGYLELTRVSPRFAVLIGAMLLSVAFIVVDILSVTHVVAGPGLPDGINPFWKLAFVFKCLTDTIVLDDFKTALDRLHAHKLRRLGGSIASDNIRGEFLNSGREEARRKRSEQSVGPMEGFPRVVTRDWTTTRGSRGGGDLDLEAALRMDYDPKADVGSSDGG